MNLFNWVDKLIGSPTKTNLMILNKVLTVGIPFNAPHGFKIKEISSEAVRISLPNRKLNHNHIGGIHACAIATVGEYCAGMSLLTTFGSSKYRLILSELSVKYSYQGRVDLEGSCSPQQIDVNAANSALSNEGKYLQKLDTFVIDKNGKDVAIVTTVWQLKSWDKVKTKS
jgi:acyl-coenzyme A thioesterase PaaI-like protein